MNDELMPKNKRERKNWNYHASQFYPCFILISFLLYPQFYPYGILNSLAGLAELADAPDSKSGGRKAV
jgi:hypothetical protein